MVSRHINVHDRELDDLDAERQRLQDLNAVSQLCRGTLGKVGGPESEFRLVESIMLPANLDMLMFAFLKPAELDIVIPILTRRAVLVTIRSTDPSIRWSDPRRIVLQFTCDPGATLNSCLEGINKALGVEVDPHLSTELVLGSKCRNREGIKHVILMLGRDNVLCA